MNHFLCKNRKNGKPASIVWFLLLMLLAAGGCSVHNSPDAPEQLILLHGLGRKGHAMFLLQKRIREAGYEAHSIEYASLQEPLDVILEMDWFRFEVQK